MHSKPEHRERKDIGITGAKQTLLLSKETPTDSTILIAITSATPKFKNAIIVSSNDK